MFKSSRNKQEKGLGLVVIALILALVSIVVIAILMLIGSINGNLSEVGGGGGVAAVSSLTWGTDNIYNKTEVCNAAGVPSGGMVYLWTENASMQYGDAFYWTGSNTAPASGYHLMSTTVCP